MYIVYLPILLLNTSQPASAVVQVLTGELGGLKRQIKQRYTSRHGFRLPTDTSTLPPHLSVSKNDDMYDQDLEALSPCTNQIQNPIYIVDLPPLVLSTSPVLTASGIRIFAAEDNTVARNVLQRFLTKKVIFFLPVFSTCTQLTLRFGYSFFVPRVTTLGPLMMDRRQLMNSSAANTDR